MSKVFWRSLWTLAVLVCAAIGLLGIFFYLSAQRNPRALYNYTQFPELKRQEGARKTGRLVVEAPDGGEVCVVHDSWDISTVIRSLDRPTYDEGVWYIVFRVGSEDFAQWVATSDYRLETGKAPFLCNSSGKMTFTLLETTNAGYVATVEQ